MTGGKRLNMMHICDSPHGHTCNMLLKACQTLATHTNRYAVHVFRGENDLVLFSHHLFILSAQIICWLVCPFLLHFYRCLVTLQKPSDAMNHLVLTQPKMKILSFTRPHVLPNQSCVGHKRHILSPFFSAMAINNAWGSLLDKQTNNKNPQSICNGLNGYNGNCIGFSRNCNRPCGSLEIMCCFLFMAC